MDDVLSSVDEADDRGDSRREGGEQPEDDYLRTPRSTLESTGPDR